MVSKKTGDGVDAALTPRDCVALKIASLMENVFTELYYKKLARLGLFCTTVRQDSIRGLVGRRPDCVEVYIYPKRKMHYRSYLKRFNKISQMFPQVDIKHILLEG